jgi:hypothetical protein
MSAHTALVREADGSLHVRRFETAAQATHASLDRELRPPKVRLIDHKTFARRLGVGSKLVRHAFRRGTFPGAVEHSETLVVIPVRFLDMAHEHGLRGLERRVKAGLIA